LWATQRRQDGRWCRGRGSADAAVARSGSGQLALPPTEGAPCSCAVTNGEILRFLVRSCKPATRTAVMVQRIADCAATRSLSDLAALDASTRPTPKAIPGIGPAAMPSAAFGATYLTTSLALTAYLAFEARPLSVPLHSVELTARAEANSAGATARPQYLGGRTILWSPRPPPRRRGRGQSTAAACPRTSWTRTR